MPFGKHSRARVHALRPPLSPFDPCPSYTVRVTTTGIEFDGRGFVTAAGKHIAKVDPVAVRHLAKKFIADDFYSLESEYRAGVTDNPTYVLSLDVDGKTKQVEDYVGSWVGMPGVVGVWESQFNRTFVQPSVGEPAELLVLTHRVESRLPADLAKRIAFIVRSFAK